jgi:ABC-2 type transport system ATP-binding protein
MTDAIVTDRLSKYYGTRRAVADLCLRVPAGTVYGLLGRNGAGKSTTLRMLAGLVRPSYGTFALLGEDGACLSPRTRGRIAYLAEGHPLYGWMTVGEAVAFSRAFYPGSDPALVERLLDYFGLSRRARIGRLSRGQRAQVSLALALAPDPELLLLDDPTLGLDTNVRRDFVESMVQVIQRRGRTILFSSHILGDVERVADRVGVMIDGVLRADCAAEHFKQAVCKVVLDFGRPPPPVPACDGLLGECKSGSRCELVFVGFGERQRAALEALGPRRLEVVALNLEDAFIEYTRGPRRPLPVLAGDDSDASGAGGQGAA